MCSLSVSEVSKGACLERHRALVNQALRSSPYGLRSLAQSTQAATQCGSVGFVWSALRRLGNKTGLRHLRVTLFLPYAYSRVTQGGDAMIKYRSATSVSEVVHDFTDRLIPNGERACWGIGPFARRVKEGATHGRTKAFGRFVRTAPRGAAVFHEVSMHSHEYRYRNHAAGTTRQ